MRGRAHVCTIYSSSYSQNVFLEGSITANTGSIAGWDIIGNTITKNNVTLDIHTGEDLKIANQIIKKLKIKPNF